MRTEGPVLGAYWAKRCPRQAHNAFDPELEPPPEPEIAADVLARIVAGVTFEATVVRDLMLRFPRDAVDLSALANEKQLHIAATEDAMAAGTRLIAGGRLPDDCLTGRTGKPDLLVRAVGIGSARYWPVDIKGHRALSEAGRRSRAASISTLKKPWLERAKTDEGLTDRALVDDLMQLAHYWRMLGANNRAPSGAAWGGIIGTDEPLVIVWSDLAEPRFKTYSDSDPRGHRLRSALERDDYEHDLRRRIAAAAGAGTEALVEPIYSNECDSCRWFDICWPDTTDDASHAVGTLGKREWIVLRSLGYRTVTQLSELDVDDDATQTVLAEQYLPKVAHVRSPLTRLGKAIRYARLVTAGQTLQRTTTGSVDVPRADIEIDFDIEFDRHGRVYLWGLQISELGRPPRYEAIAEWAELDDEGEDELARRFWNRLHTLIESANAADRSLRVYHYSHPEPARLCRIAERGGLDPHAVEQTISARFVDLLPYVRDNVLSLYGCGLKTIATQAAGFQWRSDDAGGSMSQVWFDEATTAPSAEMRQMARTRILEYNEDDVRASHLVREWLADRGGC